MMCSLNLLLAMMAMLLAVGSKAQSGSLDLPGCVMPVDTWEDLHRGHKEGRLDFKAGGLGKAADEQHKTWICLRPHPCALSDLE